MRKKEHGYSYTKLYRIWADMKSRCLNSKSTNYKNYGGRGITICDEWLNFIPFMEWALNNGYQEGLEIDRMDNVKGYNPNNCRWITHKKNCKNRRSTKLTLEKANEIRELYNLNNYTQKELAIKYNTNRYTISDIINNKIWLD